MRYIIAGYVFVLTLLALYAVQLMWRRRRLARAVDRAAGTIVAGSAVAGSPVAGTIVAGSAVELAGGAGVRGGALPGASAGTAP